MLLPAAFRSLSRLSSALSAKASALRPFLLNLFFFASPLYSVTRERLLLFLIVFLRCCAFRTALGCLFSLIDSFNIRFSRYGTGLSSCPVGLSGLEPPTSRLSGVRSNRLSYKPKFPGSRLLSHIVSNTVPSAVWGLTIVFGMGTGVSPRRITTGNIKFCLFLNGNAPCVFTTGNIKFYIWLPALIRFAHPPPEPFRCFGPPSHLNSNTAPTSSLERR